VEPGPDEPVRVGGGSRQVEPDVIVAEERLVAASLPLLRALVARRETLERLARVSPMTTPKSR
jgi:hypothetical protein